MSDTKILRVGILTEALNLDPNLAQDIDSMFVLCQMLRTPFEVQPGASDVVPVLFESFDCIDGKNTRFRATVAEGHCFPDGVPMEPAHVYHSLRQAAIMEGLGEVSLDGRDIVFHLRMADARFDVTLSHGACSVFRRINGQIAGTGPFQLGPDPGSGEIRLIRNPHFNGEITLDEIVFTVYPVDETGRPTALIEALGEGEVHLTNGVARDDVRQISGVRKSFQPGNSTAILYFNTDSPRLRDSRVRCALAHSVNRIEAASSCYSNALAFAAVNILPRGLATANDDLGHDPARAAEIFAQPDVEKPDRLTLLTTWGPRPYLPNPPAVAELLAKEFGALGIELEVTVPATSREFFTLGLEASNDLVLAGWAADTPDACDFLEANLHSDRILNHDNVSISTNYGRLASPDMDKALERYRATRGFGELEEIMRVLSDEAPLVPLMYGSTATISSFQVTNLLPSPMPVFSVAELDLQTRWAG